MDPESKAAEIQRQVHARMTGSQRLLLAIEMSEFVRELALSRLRSEHPEWSDGELRTALLRSLFGPDIVSRRSP